MGICNDDLEVVLVGNINEGALGSAETVAKIIGRELTQKEISNAIEASLAECVKMGWFGSARQDAKKLGRNLSRDELKCIIKNCLELERIDEAIDACGLAMELYGEDVKIS